MNRIISGMAVIAATSAVPAAAVTIVGATSVQITSGLNTWLQVAEFEAFDFNGVNVAAASNGGTAIGTGNFSPQSTPDKAIDGLRPGSFPNIYHSNGSGPGEMLTINFAAPTTLASIASWARADSFSSRDLHNVSIFGSSGLLWSGQLDARPGQGQSPGTFVFDAPTTPGTVPEPASWALLIAGFGLTGAAMRRRRQAVAAA